MIRLIHTADIHLDAPFAYLPFDKQTLKRQALRQALSDVVDLTLSNQASALIVAGDLFNSPNPPADTIAFVVGEFNRLAGQAQVLIVPGNHDYYQPGGVWDAAPWPDHAVVFKDDKWAGAELASGGVAVAGIACHRAGTERNVLKHLSGKSLALAIMHGAHRLDFYEGAQSYPFSESEAAGLIAGYIALGHYHNFSRVGKTSAYYCGTPEGLCFDEAGGRCALLVELGAGAANVKQLETGRYLYSQHRLDCTALSSSSELESAAAAMGGPDGLLKIDLIGTPPFGLDADAEALAVRLATNFFYIDVKDRLDLPPGEFPAGDRTVKAQFWARMQAKLADAGNEEAKQVINLAVRLGLAALEGRSQK
ncbi:MAG: DNA repair exonuclease [Actinomycetota bacterium]|nr:DNA repair exonuclease [Actinomycetota bacterium]